MKSDMTKTNITLPQPPHPIWPSSPGSQSARQRYGWSVDSLWWFLVILNREDGDVLLRYWHPWTFLQRRQNKTRQDHDPHCGCLSTQRVCKWRSLWLMYITCIWETKCVDHVSLFPYDKPSFYCTTPVAKPYIIFSHPTNHQQKTGNCRFGNSQVVSLFVLFLNLLHGCSRC